MSPEEYKFHFRFNDLIFDLDAKGVDDKILNQTFHELRNNLKPEDMFDFVRCGLRLVAYNGLDWNREQLAGFIRKNTDSFPPGKLWKIILEDNRYALDDHYLNTHLFSNADTALNILLVLLGQENVEAHIVQNIGLLKQNNNALYRLTTVYGQVCHDQALHYNIDFAVELLAPLFDNLPTLPFEAKDVKDSLLIPFVNEYRSIPANFSDFELQEILIERGILKVDDQVWKKELNMSQAEVIDFVKNRSTRLIYGAGGVWDFDYADEDVPKIKKILIVSGYRSKNPDKIEQFLKENPLTLMGQIRLKLHESFERTDEEIKTDSDIVSIIKKNLNNIFYDEILDRIKKAAVSDDLVVWELFILIKKTNIQTTISDLVEVYKRGEMSDDTRDYIVYVFPQLKRIGINLTDQDLAALKNQ